MLTDGSANMPEAASARFVDGIERVVTAIAKLVGSSRLERQHALREPIEVRAPVRRIADRAKHELADPL